MTSYRDLQRQNAQRTQADMAAALVALRLSATADMTAAGPLLTVPIMAGAARAIVIADVGVAAMLAYKVGTAVPHVGLTLTEPHAAMIAKSVETVLEHDEPAQSLGELAAMIPLDIGQDAYQDASVAHGVTEWTRRTDANPCELCRKLAGAVLPIDQRMISHPRCSCYPEPVIGADFTPTPTMRSAS